MANESSIENIQYETAVIHEIFSGIQGEGGMVGLRQIFVRFHGCNLACAFCDTPASRGTSPELCAIEEHAGSRTLAHLPNPMSISTLMASLLRMQDDYPHHSVSLTGGEPLLHLRFLNALLPLLQSAGLPSFLETNGTLADAFTALETIPDYIAMDIKLPSATGIHDCWESHAAFLGTVIARMGGDDAHAISDRLQVKLVFGEHSLPDVSRAATLIAQVNLDIPCILQPLTPRVLAPPAPSVATVLEAQRLAAQLLRNVRVIPQTHVLLKQW